MEIPSRSKTIAIGDNKYELTFGRTGDLIDIEILKAQFAKGYKNSLYVGGSLAMYSAFVIDAFATYTILAPNLLKDLLVGSLFDLDLIRTKQLVKVYMDDILPWISSWQKVLDDMEEVKTEDKANKDEQQSQH